MAYASKTAIGFCIALLTLAGCDSAIKIDQEPIPASYKRGFNMDRVSGSIDVTVRTFTRVDKDTREFAGAKCTAESDEISIVFTSPAKLRVPKFGQRKEFAHRGRPTPLRIVCKVGDKTGIASFTADDKTVQVATNAGVAGAIITAVASGAIASASPWHYPIEMRVPVDGVK